MGVKIVLKRVEVQGIGTHELIACFPENIESLAADDNHLYRDP
jgi:hypothetical protein